MKTGRELSNEVYFQIKENGMLADSQFEVYDWLFQNGPSTAREITIGVYSERDGEMYDNGSISGV